MALAALLAVVLTTTFAVKSGAQPAWDAVPDSIAPADTLSLSAALARVKRTSPALRALPLRIAAAASRVDQAGAWPNPSVSFEAENIGGSFSGFERSELSLLLAQEFELGGKRSRRADVAAGESSQIRREADARGLDLFLETKARYADIVHAEERARLLAEAEAIVAELARSAESRVRSGATLLADAALATAALARVRSAVADADALRVQARAALSTLWGDPSGFDEPVSRRIDPSTRVIAADSAVAWAARSPSVRALEAEAGLRRADAALERSLRVPDVTVAAGARRLEAEDASTFLFSVGIPLPLWDRRGAAVAAADAQLRAIETEIESMRFVTAGALASRVSNLSRMRARLLQVETESIPSLATALDNMRTAYGIGRTSYADLLEVQRTLIDLQNEANDTRRDIVAEVIAIEMLAGRPIEELTRHD
jgi:cobalt-zinc-cadmium efflux system outer membrane protein